MTGRRHGEGLIRVTVSPTGMGGVGHVTLRFGGLHISVSIVVAMIADGDGLGSAVAPHRCVSRASPRAPRVAAADRAFRAFGDAHHAAHDVQ
jgi:hypothetical protein